MGKQPPGSKDPQTVRVSQQKHWAAYIHVELNSANNVNELEVDSSPEAPDTSDFVVSGSENQPSLLDCCGTVKLKLRTYRGKGNWLGRLLCGFLCKRGGYAKLGCLGQASTVPLVGGCGPGTSPETGSLRGGGRREPCWIWGPRLRAAAGSNTASKVPREVSSAVGPGSLGRTGEKGREAQKRGAGKGHLRSREKRQKGSCGPGGVTFRDPKLTVWPVTD
ncbi:uncharacterized protein LOC115305236 [Suricata suricatta]|uniref:uncharacterized protein LOC115305236 n=1 Tax=Suricata suricatta TaxID=37032 RepID=UPI001155AFEE|nr:uncharacterized protein LOC115305236 [Suricata suricatta]